MLPPLGTQSEVLSSYTYPILRLPTPDPEPLLWRDAISPTLHFDDPPLSNQLQQIDADLEAMSASLDQNIARLDQDVDELRTEVDLIPTADDLSDEEARDIRQAITLSLDPFHNVAPLANHLSGLPPSQLPSTSQITTSTQPLPSTQPPIRAKPKITTQMNPLWMRDTSKDSVIDLTLSPSPSKANIQPKPRGAQPKGFNKQFYLVLYIAVCGLVKTCSI